MHILCLPVSPMQRWAQELHRIQICHDVDEDCSGARYSELPVYHGAEAGGVEARD